MMRLFEIAAFIAAFLLALVLAPLALGLGALWFAWRIAVYTSAARASGTIVTWSGQGSATEIERAQAFPTLAFEDRDGVTRTFTSRMAFNVYDDPPPTGALAIRYHLKPRLYAEIDDKAHWFTAPALTMAAALLGMFVAAVWRPFAAFWFGA